MIQNDLHCSIIHFSFAQVIVVLVVMLLYVLVTVPTTAFVLTAPATVIKDGSVMIVEHLRVIRIVRLMVHVLDRTVVNVNPLGWAKIAKKAYVVMDVTLNLVFAILINHVPAMMGMAGLTVHVKHMKIYLR
mgnify:CR=1 FL=1